jgi:outer membrane protein assembly factor BamB
VSLDARTTYTRYCGRALVTALFVVCSGTCPQLAAAAPKPPRLPPPALLPGDVAWQLTLPAGPAAPGAMDGAHVYLSLDSDQIAAYDRETGKLVWMRDVESAWPPLSDGATVYVAASDEVHALDAATGDTRWRVPIMRKAMAPMTLAGGMLIVLMEPDDVLAFRRSDGAALWRSSLGGTVDTFAATAGTALYVTASKGRVIALSLIDGKPIWEQMLPATIGRPAAAPDRVFVGSTNNFLYALDAGNGKLAWKWRSGGDVIGAGATKDDVYFASLDNVLRAVKRGNGNQRWRKSTPTRPIAPPRVLGAEVLVIGLSPSLSTFDALTGNPVNTYAAPGELEGEPLVDPDLRPFRVAVVVVTRDGRVVALRPQSTAFREAPAVPLTTLPGKPLTREAQP